MRYVGFAGSNPLTEKVNFYIGTIFLGTITFFAMITIMRAAGTDNGVLASLRMPIEVQQELED